MFLMKIRRGIKLLADNGIDVVDPGTINLRGLDLANPTLIRRPGIGRCGCVLAQTHGRYHDGLDELGLTPIEDGNKYGFSAFDSCKGHAWDVLTLEWREEILRQRAARKAVA